jgi:hypothetical protein
MFKLHHELGVFSNIIVCASYTRADKARLTLPIMYRTLAQVINQHPSLATILESQPSTKKKGNKRTWEALLKKIDMTECVEFVNEEIEQGKGLERVLEVEHNKWFDVKEKNKPLWRVVVVNGAHVLFVYHHGICNRKSGLIFHQSLLNALNKTCKAREQRGRLCSYPIYYCGSTRICATTTADRRYTLPWNES